MPDNDGRITEEIVGDDSSNHDSGSDGFDDGTEVGSRVGKVVGLSDGCEVGSSVGVAVGSSVGVAEGAIVGVADGRADYFFTILVLCLCFGGCHFSAGFRPYFAVGGDLFS